MSNLKCFCIISTASYSLTDTKQVGNHLETEFCETWYDQKIEIVWNYFHMLNIKNATRYLN